MLKPFRDKNQSSVVGNYNIFLLRVIPVNCLASSHTHANGPSWTSSEGFLSNTINRYERDMFKTEFVKGMERPPTLNELNTDIYIPQRKDCIEGNWESSSSLFCAASNKLKRPHSRFYQVVRSQLEVAETPLPIYRYIYQRP